MSKNVKRAISFFLGLFILSLGISFTIIADLGAGAWDALSVGLFALFGFTVGTWVILIGFILIFVNAILLKSRPEFIALITVLILGYFIDFWLLFVFPNVVPEGLALRIAILLIGVVFMGGGIAAYLQAKFAIIPIDRFMMALQSRLKVNLMVGKTIGEVTALVFAFIVGGPIGLGTIIVTISIGPIIQASFPYLERFVHGYN